MRPGQACLNCRYWGAPEKEGERKGRCEYAPPRVDSFAYNDEMVSVTAWPEAYDWEWCGAWAKQKTRVAKRADDVH